MVIVCVIREYFGILSDIGSHHYIMIYKNFQCRKEKHTLKGIDEEEVVVCLEKVPSIGMGSW